MKPDFWGKMSDEYLKHNPEPPPLNEKSLAVFEKRTGLKLPRALTELLRVKNGGPLQNTDFRFGDTDYTVTYIKAAVLKDSYEAMITYDRILGGSDSIEPRDQLRKQIGDLSKLLYLAEASGYPYAFALNYNQLNSSGEPVVLYVRLEFDEKPKVRKVADSFAKFLAGQYCGDEKPIVNLKEADKYRLIATGGYEGRYEGEPEEGSLTLGGLPIKVRWKICSHRSRLIVFQEIDWAGKPELRREEIHKSALALDFPPLESYGVDLEPELAEMIRPSVEIDVISESDLPVIPKCYELLLHIQPGGKHWVATESSSPCQGRWKNHKSTVVYSSLKSVKRTELESALRAVAASCTGPRRYLI